MRCGHSTTWSAALRIVVVKWSKPPSLEPDSWRILRASLEGQGWGRAVRES